MGVEAPLFIFALIDEGYLLFLVVYFVSFLVNEYLTVSVSIIFLNE